MSRTARYNGHAFVWLLAAALFCIPALLWAQDSTQADTLSNTLPNTAGIGAILWALWQVAGPGAASWVFTKFNLGATWVASLSNTAKRVVYVVFAAFVTNVVRLVFQGAPDNLLAWTPQVVLDLLTATFGTIMAAIGMSTARAKAKAAAKPARAI